MPEPTTRAPRRPALSRDETARLLARGHAPDPDDLETRATSLASRPMGHSKRGMLDLVIRCLDLTALDGSETVQTIVGLCERAVRPHALDPSVPSVAAVCLYPDMVPTAVEYLRGSGVRVAGVAGGFPSGLAPLDRKVGEIRATVAAGADEVDTVFNRSLFVYGSYEPAFDELVAVREAAGSAVLKVIVETGELGSPDRIRRASLLAMAAGADFVKTSTGKVALNATLPGALAIMEATRDFARETGRPVGVKIAGGIRSWDHAAPYVVLQREVLGPDWMSPDRFRIGASSLLEDVLGQIVDAGNPTDATETSYG